MSQCAWNFRTCSKSKLILKTSQFIWVAPDRSHQTCSGLWAPAPGHILRSAHVPTFTVPFQFLTAFNLKQELSGENNHELNSCLQISYRNSRLNWISRLQSIYLSDCEKVYFLCSAQNISLNGDLGIITNTNTRHVLTYWFLDHHHLHRSLLHSSMFGNFALLSLPLATRIIEQFIVFRIVQDLPMHLACLWKLEKAAIVVGWHMISAQKPFVVLQLLVSEGFPQHPKADNETN